MSWEIKVCNWLIHSFVFLTEVNEDGTIDSFFVSSDYDKNKVAYQVEISEWEKYMKFIEPIGLYLCIRIMTKRNKTTFLPRKSVGNRRNRK